jgi:hypothetical protein
LPGASDDLEPGIQDFLACHHQPCFAAIEQRWKHLGQILVHLVEGGLQPFPSLPVDAANGILQRGHRLVQVLRLCIQVGLPVTPRIEFL